MFAAAGRKRQVTFGQGNRHYALYESRQFQIGAIGSHITHASPPPFAAHFAEVEVDTETGEARRQPCFRADCGTPINPQLGRWADTGCLPEWNQLCPY